MKSKIIIGIVAAVAILGGGYTVSRMNFIGTGKVGIVYNYKDGVQDTVLTPGMHFIAPMNKVKEFSTSNEILVLTKDKRDGSKEDDSFKVATSDDASIAVSFQMSYRYDPDTVIDTYKRFKGMDGEDIIENRVKTVLKSKISEITTDYSMMDIYSGNRSELNNTITEYLNKDFHKKYGIGSNSWGRGIYFDTGVKKIYIPRGYTYIISLEVNPEVACIWNDDVNNGFDGMPNGTGNDNDNTSLRKSSDRSLVANKWQRVWFSYTPRTDVLYDIFDASSNWGIITTDAKSPIKFKIRNVKGEFGTVPTDWTPAPEDVDNKIDTAQKSADNANSSVNALNKIATKSYSFGGANGKAQWVRLGTLTSAGDASVVVITLQTGNGFNGTESQNSQAEIIIKDGWQDKASTTAAFGASVTRQNTKDLLVSVRATASNVCEVWTYLPWLYWNGNYTISGIYSGWNPNFTKQDTKPTNGVEQSLAYRTTAEDAYTLASGLKKDVDISSEFVKTYNDWAFKWKTATMVDGAEVGTYQKYITLESGNILLGHSNSKNKLKITNDSIQFKGTSDTAITPDSDATAWITGKVFHINSGEIESSLKFGKVLMKPTKNGIQIGNKAEFGERVRIGYPLSSNMQYTYSDCPLVVGSNTNTIGDYPWFAVDDGYAFVRNGIITPGDFIIKFGEYTLDRPNGGKFSGTLRPYYRADDVINMEFYVNGYVTSNKQEVIFHIPLSRPIMSTPVSISSINGLTIRQNGKYIYNSTASKPIKPASYTAAVIGGRNGLNVRAKMGIDSNGFTDTDIKNIVNNDTCAIMASIKITF